MTIDNPFYKKLDELEEKITNNKGFHVCTEHKELIKSINNMAMDMALSKESNQYIKEKIDNMEKNLTKVLEKLTDKIAKHDMWFYVSYGALLCLGYAVAQIGVLVKL